MDRRPLVASAAGGSISSLLLWALQEGLKHQPDFPSLEVTERFNISGFSGDFWLGLLLGFLLWPLLEILVLVKQWLVLSLRARIQGFSGIGPGKLYQVLHE